jgi:hypothetical protein
MRKLLTLAAMAIATPSVAHATDWLSVGGGAYIKGQDLFQRGGYRVVWTRIDMPNGRREVVRYAVRCSTAQVASVGGTVYEAGKLAAPAALENWSFATPDTVGEAIVRMACLNPEDVR